MRNAITAALALGLVATAASVPLRASDDAPQVAVQTEIDRLATPARERDGGARLQVRVYNNGMMPAADQTVALRAAAGVLAAAGIDVTWLACGDNASATNPPTCNVPVGPAELSVRFVRLAGSPSAGGQLRLGYSLVDTTIRQGKLATVYVDRVQWLAAQGGVDSGVLIGFAAAHEIGHLLLGTNAHSANGLMRAIWSLGELQHANASTWLFTAEEGTTMRSSIAQREGLRSVQHDTHATGCSPALGDAADTSTECGPGAVAALRGVAARPDR